MKRLICACSGVCLTMILTAGVAVAEPDSQECSSPVTVACVQLGIDPSFTFDIFPEG